jgi:hypothetical protein
LCGEEKDFPSFDEGVQVEDDPPAPGKPRPHQRLHLGPWRGPKPKPAQQDLAGVGREGNRKARVETDLALVERDQELTLPASQKSTKKEVTVPKLSGGNVTTRSKELKPARRAAEDLFRKGNSVTKVLAILRPTFGEISPSTVYGWKIRMSKADIKAAKSAFNAEHPPDTEPNRPHFVVKAPGSTPTLLNAVMAARPLFAERERCRRWKTMFDAAFKLLIEEG